MNEIINVVINAVDNASRKIAAVGEQVDAAGKKMQGLGEKMTTFVSLPLAGIGFAAIKSAGEMEQLDVAFTTMLGSAEKAKTLLQDIEKFSASTPFQFDEIANASRSLIAYGFEQDEIIDKMTMFGDVAAGVGAPIGELSQILGKIKAAGFVETMDIDQIAGRGIPIMRELAKVTGIAESEIRKMANPQERGYTFDEIIQAFENMTKEGGQFSGMMEKQSQTIFGLWSTLRDNIVKITRSIGNTIIKEFNIADKLKVFIEFIQGLADKFDGLSGHTKKMVVIFGAIAIAMGPVLVALGFIVSTLATLTPAIIGATAVIGALAGGAMMLLGNESNKVGDAIKGIWQSMKDAWSFMMDFFAPILEVTKTNILNLWNTIETQLLPTFRNLWEVHGDQIVQVLKIIGGLFATTLLIAVNGIIVALNLLISVFSGLLNIMNTVWAFVKAPFQMAIAGITGDFALFKDALDDVVEALKGVWDWAVKVYDKVKSVVGLGGKSGKSKKVDDAVISPSGDIVSTHPDDWLIATKNPASLGGGGTNLSVYLNGNTFLGKEGVAKEIGNEIVKQIQMRTKLSY